MKIIFSLKRNMIVNYNPTGFFSDMHESLDMARKSKVYFFGKGDCQINPIDGRDLAKVCVRAVEIEEHRINAGGPEIFTYTQIAEVAFKTLNNPIKIMYIPNWVKNTVLFLLRKFTSVRFKGQLNFCSLT